MGIEVCPHPNETGTIAWDGGECKERGTSTQGKYQGRQVRERGWEVCTKASELHLWIREHFHKGRSIVCAARGYRNLPRAVVEEL